MIRGKENRNVGARSKTDEGKTSMEAAGKVGLREGSMVIRGKENLKVGAK